MGSFWIHWQWQCPTFLRQTFVEWSAQTINKSYWAGLYYYQQRAKGCSYQTAVRALAFKYSSCQRAAGAPVVAWATYARESLEIDQGAMHWHKSSPGVTRGICSDCGSSITYDNAKRPGENDISLNTLDDPTSPTLKAHIWTEDKQPWMRIGDDLPAYKKTVCC